MITLGTKAETLERLQPLLNRSKILPSLFFSKKAWDTNRSSIQAKVKTFFQRHSPLVVRSSSMFEDNEHTSHAGGFKSFLNVGSEEKVFESIEEVFYSFSEMYSDDNQVLIQPHLKNVIQSGVIFTRDLATLAPYYIVNYDDKENITDSITSGTSNDLKTFIIFKDKIPRNKFHRNLIEAIKELETLCGIDYLDIEFAINRSNEVYIFQVRPIVIKGKRLPSSRELGKYIDKIKKKVHKITSPHPYLLGEKSTLGVMTDWNPAEMIGVRPRPLSISLYKELITDKTWAYQRHNYGYRNLRSFPLLHSLLGIPYIDIKQYKFIYSRKPS